MEESDTPMKAPLYFYLNIHIFCGDPSLLVIERARALSESTHLGNNLQHHDDDTDGRKGGTFNKRVAERQQLSPPRTSRLVAFVHGFVLLRLKKI